MLSKSNTQLCTFSETFPEAAGTTAILDADYTPCYATPAQYTFHLGLGQGVLQWQVVGWVSKVLILESTHVILMLQLVERLECGGVEVKVTTVFSERHVID